MDAIKLCVISYYGPKESIELAENALKSENITVFDYPLFKFMHDAHSKIDNYVENLIEFIKTNQITHILWWFINIPTDEFILIKQNTNVKYTFFNWDEPYNWKCCDIVNKAPYFDAVFVTCKESLNDYNKFGCNNAYCLYPGYDENIHYPINDINFDDYNNYNCDISFCCTNLYSDEKLYPNQYISREKLIKDVYDGQELYNYTFYIYGPEFLKTMFPKSYRGFANYHQLNKIFNYSKINLCTHVLSNKYGYLNERVILIGASGGLLLVDYIDGIEDEFNISNEIVILDKHYYVKQITSILNDYEKYLPYRAKFNDKSKNFTYQKWAKFITVKLHNL